jgi:hypothetical protein
MRMRLEHINLTFVGCQPVMNKRIELVQSVVFEVFILKRGNQLAVEYFCHITQDRLEYSQPKQTPFTVVNELKRVPVQSTFSFYSCSSHTGTAWARLQW